MQPGCLKTQIGIVNGDRYQDIFLAISSHATEIFRRARTCYLHSKAKHTVKRRIPDSALADLLGCDFTDKITYSSAGEFWYDENVYFAVDLYFKSFMPEDKIKACLKSLNDWRVKSIKDLTYEKLQSLPEVTAIFLLGSLGMVPWVHIHFDNGHLKLRAGVDIVIDEVQDHCGYVAGYKCLCNQNTHDILNMLVDNKILETGANSGELMGDGYKIKVSKFYPSVPGFNKSCMQNTRLEVIPANAFIVACDAITTHMHTVQ